MLGRPATARARAIVIRPDDFVQEARPAEDLVQEHLYVVDLAVVEVDVQGPAGLQHPAHFAQARGEKREVVGVDVQVARGAQRNRTVATPLEANAVAGRVTAIKVPARAQPNLQYGICVVSGHKTGALAFVDRVVSKAGQAKLLAAGFLPRVKPVAKKK